MGYGTLRQIRVKPNSCRVHHAIINLTQECAQGSILSNEDETDYCNAWDEKTPLTEYLPSCSRPEFKFTSASEIDSMPYWAGKIIIKRFLFWIMHTTRQLGALSKKKNMKIYFRH